VRVEESELERFSTGGVRVAENFNDSNSGLTFCLLIVTVCATNMRKQNKSKQTSHWATSSLTFQQEMIMAIQKCCSLHSYTQGRFQVSSVTRAHHATFSE